MVWENWSFFPSSNLKHRLLAQQALNLTMNYTKSDLQLSSDALFDAIIQVGKELEKKNTPRGRALSKKLLENFNKYDVNHMTKMLNDFQRFLVESIKEEKTLDVKYVVDSNLETIRDIISAECRA